LTSLNCATLSFKLQYDSSKAAPLQFSVVCFFERGKRWQNVRILPSGSYISVTAKIVAKVILAGFTA
jgi:hypothetical protein